MKEDVNSIITRLKSKGMQSGPYFEGIATFLKAPYKTDLKDLDIGLIGLPFDLGTTNYPGARLAPREVRNKSKAVGIYNHQTKLIPLDIARVADIGDVPLPNRLNLDKSIKDIEDYYLKLVESNIKPITIGGDHSVTFPILKALGSKEKLAVIQIDAHCDTDSDYYGAKNYHGATFKNAVEAGVIDPNKTVQLGIRGTDDLYWKFSQESGMKVIHIEEYHQLGLERVILTIKEIVGNTPAYISFDIDSLDPAFAPGTGTPVVGGFSSYEALQILRNLRGLNIIGGDVVEYCPPFDNNGITALVAATVMFEILCLVSENINLKNQK